MQKINFQNLPNTTTPVNATNLNALQDNVEDVFDGDEAMGNIVVDSIRSKNLINLSLCTYENCEMNSNNSIKSNINNAYYCSFAMPYLNSFILANKGKEITASINEGIPNRKISITIYGSRSGGGSYQEFNSSDGARYASGTIADDFTSITKIEVRVNRASSPFTDTTTIISNLMLELDTLTPTNYVLHQSILSSTSLYHHPNGIAIGSANLSDSVSNYEKIDIVYHSNDSIDDISVKTLYKPYNGMKSYLHYMFVIGNTVYEKVAAISIVNNSVVIDANGEFAIGSGTISSGYNIFITDVVGYR